MIEKIIKRNGNKEEFDSKHIEGAIRKAMNATEDSTYSDVAGKLTGEVVSLLEKNFVDETNSVTVEETQDCCEKVLMHRGFDASAKAFIIYRQQHAALRDIKSATDFCEETIEGYTGEPDASEFLDSGADVTADTTKENWHVKQNASVSYSIGAMILNNSERITKAHWLNKFYDAEIRQAYQEGSIHIHDLGMLSGYCAGWSLKKLIKEGLGGVPGKVSSAPAKHLSALCNQMVNFLGIMQNEWAGAQAFSSFDTYLAPFVKVDHLSYGEVKQGIQNFVYGVNVPSRWGTQAPFSNITLDWTVPEDLSNLPAIVGGKDMDFTYGDCKPEMDMVNKAFLEVMIEGDCNGRGFAYPIPTYSITKEFDWSDTENNRLLFEMAAKYGTPYFSNYINSDMKPSDVRSMCCRLRLDLRELRKQNGGNFGAGENTGSIGVVTINMPRIAFLAEDERDFFVRLEKMMDISARSLDVKRKVINTYINMGMYPYTKRYLPEGFKNHFSTIGLVGMNEACLNANWLRKDMSNKEASDWTAKVLDFMRNKLSDYQELYGNLFNLEATPAESTAYRFARHDKQQYPSIITAGTAESPYYTNSSHLPVNFTDDVFAALEIQDNLQTKYTSGTVFHCFLGEKLPSWKSAADLIKKVAENFRLPYFTLSPVYSVCEAHGYLAGDQPVCPICGKKAEVYSRITGYYRPVSNWNDGKAEEFRERKAYNIGGDSGSVKMVPKSDPKPEAVTTQLKDQMLLFTTPTCSNCKVVKASGVLKNMDVKEIDATADENRSLVDQFGIQGAPTLIVIKDGATAKYDNASAIIGFAKKA